MRRRAAFLLTKHLDPPVSCRTMGSRFRQRTRSAAIVSFSLQLTPLACKSSLNVDRQVFGRPLFLLPSADVHSIARRAGRSGAIHMTWPANQNLLPPTMSCSRLYPVRASTSAFDTLFFHVTPMIFLKFRWWNTSSLFCIVLLLFHVSLAYMAVDTTTAVYNCSLIFRPREPDFHMLLSLLKTVAAFASRVSTFFLTSCPSISRCRGTNLTLILHRFRDIAFDRSKITIFGYPCCV